VAIASRPGEPTSLSTVATVGRSVGQTHATEGSPRLYHVPPRVYSPPVTMERPHRRFYCPRPTRPLVLGMLFAAGVLSASCTPSHSGPEPAQLVPDRATTTSAAADAALSRADASQPVNDAQATFAASGGPDQNGPLLAPLVTDPPATVRAARASDATYATFQGVVCGVVPRPEYGYTVRYPKIWTAREQGPTTWLADYTDDNRLVGVVDASSAPAQDEDLAGLIAYGWRARKLDGLQLDPVAGGLVGGQPAARWDVQFQADDGTPMMGYAAATIANGQLYRVEVALPAARHEHLARAAALVAEQLIIVRSHEGT